LALGTLFFLLIWQSQFWNNLFYSCVNALLFLNFFKNNFWIFGIGNNGIFSDYQIIVLQFFKILDMLQIFQNWPTHTVSTPHVKNSKRSVQIEFIGTCLNFKLSAISQTIGPRVQRMKNWHPPSPWSPWSNIMTHSRISCCLPWS